MAQDAATKTRTTHEILGSGPARNLVHDIFADLHPALIDETRDLASIFTAQSANEFLSQLMNFEKLLSVDDSYEATVKKLQAQIDEAESIRDSLLAQIFEQIRPLEKSYRELMLFFENSKVPDGKVRKPVELYILNADAKILGGVTEFMKVAALAQANDLDIAPHGSQDIHVHLVAAISNGLILEFYRDTVDPMWGRVYRHTLTLNSDGTVSPPNVPGIGADPDYDSLAEFRVA